MAEALWRAVAWVVCTPAIADWIIQRAMCTPGEHLKGYMNRYNLFNPHRRWFPFSIRVHHILRADAGLSLHDHPWNARTIILKGSYEEMREDRTLLRTYAVGATHAIPLGSFHRVTAVDERIGAVTLFFMGRFRRDWSFQAEDGTLTAAHKEATT